MMTSLISQVDKYLQISVVTDQGRRKRYFIEENQLCNWLNIDFGDKSDFYDMF